MCMGSVLQLTWLLGQTVYGVLNDNYKAPKRPQTCMSDLAVPTDLVKASRHWIPQDGE